MIPHCFGMVWHGFWHGVSMVLGLSAVVLHGFGTGCRGYVWRGFCIVSYGWTCVWHGFWHGLVSFLHGFACFVRGVALFWHRLACFSMV